MKQLLLACVAAVLVQSAIAQEKLPRAETLKVAFLLCLDLKHFQGTAIPTDVDLKHAVAVRHGEYGAMVLPETKLTKDTLKKVGGDVLPIGQLWLHKLTPLRDGDAVPASQLRLVNIDTDGRSASAVQCALGLKKNGDNLDLLLFGKDKSPLATARLQKKEAQQESPIDLDAEHEGDSGRIIIHLLGQYDASFKITELPE